MQIIVSSGLYPEKHLAEYDTDTRQLVASDIGEQRALAIALLAIAIAEGTPTQYMYVGVREHGKEIFVSQYGGLLRGYHQLPDTEEKRAEVKVALARLLVRLSPVDDEAEPSPKPRHKTAA